MEKAEKESKLEITVNTNIRDFLRKEYYIDGRVAGFLYVLYEVGKIKNLGDVSKLRDVDVFMIDQFSELSLFRLNNLLKRYNVSSLNVDMDKKTEACYRRRVDFERKKLARELGVHENYRFNIALYLCTQKGHVLPWKRENKSHKYC